MSKILIVLVLFLESLVLFLVFHDPASNGSEIPLETTNSGRVFRFSPEPGVKCYVVSIKDSPNRPMGCVVKDD